MGCSSSKVESAQIQTICRICEEETYVKWKCIDCKFQMCSKCAGKEHLKYTNAKNHLVIDIRDERKIEERSKNGNRSVLELKGIKKYQTGIFTIFRLAIDCNNSIWIYDINSEVIQRVNINGGDLNIAANFKKEISSMAAIQPNVFLLSTFSDSVLKMYDDKTQTFVDSQFKISPLKPKAIHVTRENNVVIGAENVSKKRDVVLVMDDKGKQKGTYDKYENNEPIFTFTAGITSTKDNTIVVIDWLDDEEGIGQIVLLGRGGGVRNIYTGHPHVNNEDNLFTPSSIVSTPADRLVVADFKNNSLHVLNNSGFMVSLINSQNINIPNPYSLAINKQGQLVVGNNPDDNKNAKLFKAELVESK